METQQFRGSQRNQGRQERKPIQKKHPLTPLSSEPLTLPLGEVGFAEQLQAILDDFTCLLDRNPHEEVVQQFLANHKVLLAPTALRVKSKVLLGEKYETDFVIEQAPQEYVPVEIEAPGRPLFTKGGDPSKYLTHALRQVKDWRQWIHENIAYADKILPGIMDPSCLVIIGRETMLGDAERKALRRENREHGKIEIWTYDDLLNKVRQCLQNLEPFR